MTIPKINIDDFEYWCLIHKKIPKIGAFGNKR